MRIYKTYAKDKETFCEDHYYQSDVYYPSERSSYVFLQKYHDCLQSAGKKKGKKYCDDVTGANEDANIQDLFDCYTARDVSLDLYAEDLCMY